MRTSWIRGAVRIGVVLVLLMVVSSTGCIKYFQNVNSDERETPVLKNSPADSVRSQPATSVLSEVADIPSPVVTANSPGYLEVNEVDASQFITPDPYKLPYRDHGNWSTLEPVRVQKIPQFTKSYILRSNATAVRVNVTQAPLIIYLTFRPQWADPDNTGVGSQTNDEGKTTSGTNTNSFVFSKAVVTVYSDNSHTVVGQEGYGREFSVDLEKKITVYREGRYTIALEGDFMDLTIAIATGSAGEPVTPAPTVTYDDWEEY